MNRHALSIPAALVVTGFLASAPPPGPLVRGLLTPEPARAAQPLRRLPPYVAGFPLLFPRPVDVRPRAGAVAAADLDHDGRAELVASVPAGLVTVADSGGTRHGWPRRFDTLPQPAWPVGSPGIGDLDGDGRDEVVVCVSAGASPRQAVIVALRADGTDLPGWPVRPPASDPYTACSPGGTLVADLDGDGRGEVIQVIGADEVWVFDGSGSPLPGWPFHPAPDAGGRPRPINAAPAAADVDGDGRAEVIAVESGLAPRLFVLGSDGRMSPGFPVLLPEVVDRQAPVAGDVDGDGHPEIVQATLPFAGDQVDPSGTQSAVPGALHSLRGDGREGSGWPHTLDGGASWGAILIDLDGDGRPEILQGEGDSLLAFDGSGTLLSGFPLSVHRVFMANAVARLDSQWTAADLDGDGQVDFLRALGAVGPGTTALRMVAIQSHGQPVSGFPFTLNGLLPASDPVLLDMTGDGAPEVAILAGEGTNGGWRLLAWDRSGPLAGRAAGSGPRPEPAPLPVSGG